MTLTNTLIVLATLLSPLIAVQATRWLDERKEKQSRKLQVYKTLMSTRAYTLAIAHVEALNRIDLEFSPKKKAEKAVLDVWQEYLDHLGNKAMKPEAWADKRVDLLVDLLYAMGKVLGYDFNKTQIKNGTYSPVAHGRLEEEQEKLRQYAIELFEHKRSLPMHLTNIPNQTTPPEE